MFFYVSVGPFSQSVFFVVPRDQTRSDLVHFVLTLQRYNLCTYFLLLLFFVFSDLLNADLILNCNITL